ncbi:MAG: KH domain-containing protein, partial [Candidatus Uhrbacteria bacterium]
EEIPYTSTVVVEDITERDNGMIAIEARILTTHDRYRRMLIGSAGKRVKQIGQMARKELEAALQTRVYLDLHVETDSRWVDRIANAS